MRIKTFGAENNYFRETQVKPLKQSSQSGGKEVFMKRCQLIDYFKLIKTQLIYSY